MQDQCTCGAGLNTSLLTGISALTNTTRFRDGRVKTPLMLSVGQPRGEFPLPSLRGFVRHV
jgi:hypothetical protein